MSIIAVKGIPQKWSLTEVIKVFAKSVAGPFEPLNFGQNQKFKIVYLRLSERLDPVRVVERINSATIGSKGLKFTAYVPEHVPDLPLGEKRKKIPLKLRNSLNIPELDFPHEVIVKTHHEVFLELQYKYPGLYNLSHKTGHKLLDELSRVLGDRLIHIMESSPETKESSFQLSKWYRKTHPHFGDFQLILTTLHQLQDASGAPRAHIQEAELASVDVQPYVIENVPLDQVKTVCQDYTERITAAITAHVKSLDTKPSPDDKEEDIARKKVREELKKMLPYMPTAMKQLIASHFVPEELPFKRIRIYGEPFLPARESMQPFIRRYNTSGSRIIRSQRMYNLLTLKVDQQQYIALKAMDATVINGAKLTIRTDIPIHAESEELRTKLAARFGGQPPVQPRMDEDEEDEDWQE